MSHAQPKVWPYLFAFADKNGDLERNNPYILATEWEGQALRLAHIRENNDLLCYAYAGKWPPLKQPVQAAPGAVDFYVCDSCDHYYQEEVSACDCTAAALSKLRHVRLYAAPHATPVVDDAFSDGVILALQVMTAAGDMGCASYEELLQAAGDVNVYRRAETEGMLEISGLAAYVQQDMHAPSIRLRAALEAAGRT